MSKYNKSFLKSYLFLGASRNLLIRLPVFALVLILTQDKNFLLELKLGNLCRSTKVGLIPDLIKSLEFENITNLGPRIGYPIVK